MIELIIQNGYLLHDFDSYTIRGSYMKFLLNVILV